MEITYNQAQLREQIKDVVWNVYRAEDEEAEGGAVDYRLNRVMDLIEDTFLPERDEKGRFSKKSTRWQMLKWNWRIFYKEWWRVKQNWAILNDRWDK